MTLPAFFCACLLWTKDRLCGDRLSLIVCDVYVSPEGCRFLNQIGLRVLLFFFFPLLGYRSHNTERNKEKGDQSSPEPSRKTKREQRLSKIWECLIFYERGLGE